MILNACFGRKLFKNVCDCVMFEGNTGPLGCCFSFSNSSCSKEKTGVSSFVSIFVPDTLSRRCKFCVQRIHFTYDVQLPKPFFKHAPFLCKKLRTCWCRMKLYQNNCFWGNTFSLNASLATLVSGLLLQGHRMIWKKWLALPWLKLSLWWKLARFLRLMCGWNLDWDFAGDVFEYILESCHDKDMVTCK